MMLAWIKVQAGSEGGKEYDLRIKFSVCISPIYFFASLWFTLLFYIILLLSISAYVLLFLFLSDLQL